MRGWGGGVEIGSGCGKRNSRRRGEGKGGGNAEEGEGERKRGGGGEYWEKEGKRDVSIIILPRVNYLHECFAFIYTFL